MAAPCVSQQALPEQVATISMTLRSGKITYRLLAGILLLLLMGSLGWAYRADQQPKVPATATADYVGRQSCASCHQPQHDLFLLSHHHKALAEATDETVSGDFSDQTLQHDDLTSRFYRDGQRFMVDTEGPDGNVQSFEVLYVLAYTPLQQYMVQARTDGNPVDQEKSTGLSALQVLRLCWDVEKKKWFYLRPEDVPEKLEPGDPLHWTGVTQRWNTSCAACHSTELQKNFDPKSNQFHTTFSEIDVSCESCHGPASLHVEIAKKRWVSWDPVHGKGLFSLKNATAKQQIDTCASCHSRRRLLSEDYHETRQIHDHLIYEPMRRETYFVDGQIKDEDYVYGSFIQSKMHLKGIRCTDCHDPHSGQTRYPGNLLCTSCHQHPAGTYDSTQHHGHQPNSPGSQCVECHMPHRVYMDVDPRRDHSIRVPRPDLSVKLGVPNACTGCHLKLENVPVEQRAELARYQDWQRLAEEGNEQVIREIQRVDQWADEVVQQWRAARGKPIEEPHFGEILAAVRELSPEDRSDSARDARKQLTKVATDLTRSPMYRITSAAEFSGWRDQDSLKTSLDLLEDNDAEVVFFALQRVQSELGRLLEYLSYGASPQQTQASLQRLLQPVVQLLQHDQRLVRNQAASVLTSIPESIRLETVGADLKYFEQAYDELIQVHLLNEEMAAVADLYQALGQWDRAKEYYRLAIKHSPHEFGARTNLAVLLDEEMQAQLRDLQSGAAGGATTAGEMKQRLTEMRSRAETAGLEIARLRQEDFEILETEVARSGHLPTAGDIHYRFAMALYLRGEMELAGEHLQTAVDKNPDVEAYLLGLATFHQAQNNWQAALPLAQRLVLMDPQHPGYRSLLKAVQDNLADQEEAGSQTP